MCAVVTAVGVVAPTMTPVYAAQNEVTNEESVNGEVTSAETRRMMLMTAPMTVVSILIFAKPWVVIKGFMPMTSSTNTEPRM